MNIVVTGDSNFCSDCRDRNATKISKRMSDGIDELVVVCCVTTGACEWTGELKDYDKHQEVCPLQSCDCPLFKINCCGLDCNGRVKRSQLSHHLADRTQANNCQLIVNMAEQIQTLSNAVSVSEAATQLSLPSVTTFECFDTEEQMFSLENCRMKKDLDGDVYCGEMTPTNDAKHGIGCLTFKQSAGDYYAGQWRLSERHGLGVDFMNNGTHIGEWVEGKFEGYGIKHWANGAIYHGEWKDFKQHGQY
jgi:hypothetical protein